MSDTPEYEKGHDQPVDEFLALSDRDGRADLLRRSGLLDPDGLDVLLDRADDLINSDPGRGKKLAEYCMELAEAADAPAAVPRGNYILAQASFANGEFGRVLELTEKAKEQYRSRGMSVVALRTDVGKMAALLELGRYEDALDLSQRTLLELDNQQKQADPSDASEFHAIAALLHLNRGGCYEYMGLYDEAFTAYDLAEKFFVEADMTENLSQVNDNRGILLLSLGRGDEALEIFERSARKFAESGMHMAQVRSLINIGYTQLQLGNYMSSLGHFEKAQRILEPVNALADEHGLLLDTADAYAAMNLHSEALSAYGRVLELPGETGAAHERALALWGTGSVLVDLGQLDEADETLHEAGVLFEEAGNIPLQADVLLERAMLVSFRGDVHAALELARKALDLVLHSEEWPRQKLNAHLAISGLLTSDLELAEWHVREAEKLLVEMSLPQLRYRYEESMGRVYFLQGRREEALELYASALERIERLRGTVVRDSMRVSLLDDKMSVYEGMLELVLDISGEHDGDDVLRAFDVAEQAKSRALAELLTGITSRAAVSSENAGLEEQLKVLQANLNAVYGRLLGNRTETEEWPPLQNLQSRATELEGEISRLRLRLDASGSELSDTFEAPARQESLPDRLSPDVAMLAYHVLGDEVLAFVSSGGNVRVKRRVGSAAKVRESLRKLDSQWDRFRSGQVFSERQMQMLQKSTGRVLAALYDEVFRPVESLLEDAVENLDPEGSGVPKLAIIPHGPLHQAPFHAFFDGEKYLLERFEVSYAPSASVFALCQERESRPLERAVTVGVSDELVPAASDEAAAVARLFPESEVLLDEQATSGDLEMAVAGCGLLHMACHGLFRSDNPMFSALKLHGGWLLAHDAMGLDLDSAVVALSACESGRNVVVGGDEILGLTRAFLGARAATLLVSLWIVHDDTTPELMRHFYGFLISGDPPATALRAAQLETRKTHPHPYYWAPFITVGKR